MARRFRPTLETLDARVVPAVFGNPWPSQNLTLSFVPDGTDVNGQPSRLADAFPGVPADVWRGEILRAFQTWAAAANVNIGVVPDGGQPLGVSGSAQGDARFGDARIAAVPLAPTVAALAAPFDPVAGTRAGDVLFNTAVPFSVGGATGSDIFSVALHEAGHVLGVPENEDSTSAMYDEALTHVGLNAHDVAAVVALYGPRRADAFDAKTGNETTKTATAAQVGSGPGSSATANVTADITTPTDADVYTFQASNLRGQGLTATVHVAGLSLLAPRFELLDATGRVIAAGTGGPGTDATVHVDSLTSGATYFARVTAGRSDVFGVGGYLLELRPDAASAGGGGTTQLLNPDAGSNDTLGTASQLGQQFQTTIPGHVGYALAASLGTTTDVDFYRVKSPQTAGNAPVTLTITVSTTPPGRTDPVVDVYDKNGVKVPGRVFVHDGGAFAVQVPNTAPNADYFVAVRHAHPGAAALAGNYSLAIDFGTPAIQLTDFTAGTLTAAAPVGLYRLNVTQAQVLHLVFDLSENGSAAGGIRYTVVDARGAVVDSRFVPAGDVASTNVYLRPGTYGVILSGGATDGTTFTSLRYILRGSTLSDPVGPQPVGTTTTPTGTPPTPPPAPIQPTDWGTVGTYTPVQPVGPTTPPWWVAPPTDWTPANLALLTGLLFG